MKDAYVRIIFCCVESFPSSLDHIYCIPVLFTSETTSFYKKEILLPYKFLLYKLYENLFLFL